MLKTSERSMPGSPLGISVIAFIVFAILSASLFIAVEAHHECHGDACEICRALGLCAQTVRIPCRSVGVCLLFSMVALAFHFRASIMQLRVFLTPISLKVRLNS